MALHWWAGNLAQRDSPRSQYRQSSAGIRITIFRAIPKSEFEIARNGRCVVDKDQWTPAQFDALMAWQREQSVVFRGVALSNPKFELWLLAHFQGLPATCGASECDRLLEVHHPAYRKRIDHQRFDLKSMRAAIANASASCPIGTIPLASTGTNVGELVGRILASSVDRHQFE